MCSTEQTNSERWKLDVNDRYQKAVATVITLSSAALVSPIVFLKDMLSLGEHNSIVTLLNRTAYIGWILLAVSIVCGLLYYYFSAKWTKLALTKSADVLWVPLNEKFSELALDLTYFFMMIGFLGGTACMLRFMATYVVPKCLS
ncbi:MAG: hypothetical protein ACRD59_14770 [Candidatus Acidiferrales bacterium]